MEKLILSELLQAGAVQSIVARGVPGGYVLFALTETGERMLTTQRGAIRVFSQLDTVARFLHGLGMARFSVDATNWSRSTLL